MTPLSDYGSAEEKEWASWDALGLKYAELRPLTERLAHDFEPEAYGYAQFKDLESPLQRAVVSDQLWGAPEAAGTNLLEARLHEREVYRLIGDEGLSSPTRTTSPDEQLRHAELTMHITGFFRGVGSALDCMAAASIAVLRLPMSITRADLSQLGVVETLAERSSADRPEEQLELWRELARILEAQRQSPPPGWLDWTRRMRHALVHRPRQFQVYLQRERPSAGRLIIVVNDPETPAALARFDPYLRQHPWLPDLYDMTLRDRGEDLWLHEPAQQTITGIRGLVNDLLEVLASFLLHVWHAAAAGDIRLESDPSAWRLRDQPDPEFIGVSPGTFPPFDHIRMNTVAVKARPAGGAAAPAPHPAGAICLAVVSHQ